MPNAHGSLNFEAWQSDWLALGAHNSLELDSLELKTVHSALLARYAESHRHYHSQQHLAECLDLLKQWRSLAQHPEEVAIALWFHDAIYDVHAHDNEQKSAEWADAVLAQQGISADQRQRIVELILATRHQALPTAGDQSLLVDIDLAILGAQPARFAEYESQIRLEYAFVDEATFADKRSAVMRGFAQRARIYATALAFEHLEPRARQNLACYC